ncbi:MAG: hypothetical protein WED09_10375 [Homoserinimonas sp.]
MNDQTRGGTPGTGSDPDVHPKRDRKRLRSSEPWPPPATPVADPMAPQPAAQPEEIREPELTPVEQLFAGQWTASLPTPVMPSAIPPEPVAVTPVTDAAQHYDVDVAEDQDGEPSDAAGTAPASRFGLGLLKKIKREAAAEPALDEPAAEPPAPVQTAIPYVPPGGFTGPGHPRLGPLAPEPIEKHSGLAGLDIAAMVAAILLPPIGLITAVVALIRGRQVRGWASDLARAAVSVSLVMTVVFVGVGGYAWIQEIERAEQLAAAKTDQRAHALVGEASVPFCEVLEAHPTIYSTADPDYGWPVQDAPGGYNAAIAEYAAVWVQVAEAAPEGIAEETAAISERVAGIVSIANALGSSNRAGDLLGLHAETDLATVESWYVEYCDAPEIPAE